MSGGLPVNGASLAAGAVRLGVELWRDEKMQMIENLCLSGENLDSRYGLAGFPVIGTLIATPAGTRELELARGCAEDCAELPVACTLIDGILACRALAGRTGLLRSIFERLWCTLRPAMLGCAPAAPRIWAT